MPETNPNQTIETYQKTRRKSTGDPEPNGTTNAIFLVGCPAPSCGAYIEVMTFWLGCFQAQAVSSVSTLAILQECMWQRSSWVPLPCKQSIGAHCSAGVGWGHACDGRWNGKYGAYSLPRNHDASQNTLALQTVVYECATMYCTVPLFFFFFLAPFCRDWVSVSCLTGQLPLSTHVPYPWTVQLYRTTVPLYRTTLGGIKEIRSLRIFLHDCTKPFLLNTCFRWYGMVVHWYGTVVHWYGAVTHHSAIW